MVENQSGVNTFLSFGTKSVKPEILEQLLVGRKENIDLLTQFVEDISLHGLNHQVIVVAQRGMGKTHLLRVLYYRSQLFLSQNKLVIAYFSEEEYGIAGYLDFLIRVLNAFMRWNDEDREALGLEMDVLRETHPNSQVDVAEKIILDYIGNRPLLILAENFDTILEALGTSGQNRLRAFLYRHNRTSIIATSQALSPDLGREDLPFFNFFTTIYLNKLSYEDSLALLRTLAKVEKQEQVIEHLNGKGIAQVRAIHELVKGNHRLLITFYEFLKADTLASLSKLFIKTLNDLKPYYETFIRYLPQQQQKILYYIALAKIPQNGTEIAKNCFIEAKTLSKQLSELNRRNLIDVIPDPSDKRNKLYDIAEPLLRISIEIGEHREGISALFIDFLALYYSMDELKTQKIRFENLYSSESNPERKQDLWHDIQAREKAMILKIELEANKKPSKALLEMQQMFENDEYKSVIKMAQDVPEWEKNENYYFMLGTAYSVEREFKNAIDSFQKAIEIEPTNFWLWRNLGEMYIRLKDYKNAIAAYKKAIEIEPTHYWFWRNLGETYFKLKDYKKAIAAYQKVIETGILFLKNINGLVFKMILYEAVSESFIFILKNKQDIDNEQLKYLESLIVDGYGLPQKLEIIYRYLQIYRRYVVEKDERAILELPKEQRAFFLREILGKEA